MTVEFQRVGRERAQRTVPRLVVLSTAVLLAACSASRGPVLGRGEHTPAAGGTISGIVRALEGDTPLSARKVTAIHIETGQRIEASTTINGGYTMKVVPGRYRLEVELRRGEMLATAPDEVQISPSDLDASRNFVIRTGA
jgi:hypothetical protein